MKKKIEMILILAMIICGAFWAKMYYNDRYVVLDSYYTQIPVDEVNTDSWLVDADGVQQEKGKSYTLIGYNNTGEQREVNFIKKGIASDYYAPGTYIKVDVSKTLTAGVEVVEESVVPKKALEKINSFGTRKQ